MSQRPSAFRSALWLSWLYVALVGYASLYPFVGWRDQGLDPWFFLWAPWSRYWTSFDVTANFLAYIPLGALLTLLFAARRLRAVHIHHLIGATLLASCLSLGMEMLQSYLPTRVPSQLDWILNTGGSLFGALTVHMLDQQGWLHHWRALRERWLIRDSVGGLVLLLLWPMALLFPPALPFGLGDVLGHVFAALRELTADTLWATQIETWLVEPQPWALTAGMECLVATFGMLLPCMLAFSVMQPSWRRAVVTLLLALVGLSATAVSSALSFGPLNVLAWASHAVLLGVLVAITLALLAAWLPLRATLVLGVGVSLLMLTLVNQLPNDPYITSNLNSWELSRYMRFHGLGQWLGWAWPFAVLFYLLVRLFHPAATSDKIELRA
jgi:VanZ family protein